jgi:hypothetical protein
LGLAAATSAEEDLDDSWERSATPENAVELADVPEDAEVTEMPHPALTSVRFSGGRGDPRVCGVLLEERPDGDLSVIDVGAVMVRVIGPIAGGDLLQASATPGVAERQVGLGGQVDDIVRSRTLGKVRRGDNRTDERLVAVTLLCG